MAGRMDAAQLAREVWERDAPERNFRVALGMLEFDQGVLLPLGGNFTNLNYISAIACLGDYESVQNSRAGHHAVLLLLVNQR